MRLVVDRQGSDPERRSQEFYDRLIAGGVQVCVVRATKPRAPFGPLGERAARRAGTSRGLGHIDHRKLVVVDGRVGWVGGAGIEDHFQDGRFHDLFLRVDRAGRRAAPARLPRELPLARRRDPRRRRSTRSSRLLEAGASPSPRVVLHNAPGRYRPITDAIARLLDERPRDARRRQPVRHRPRDDRADRAGGPARRPRPPLRPGEREQLGVRCGAAASTTRRSSTPACASSSTRRCCTRRRSCATARSVLAGTCNLEAWSLKRFFEIDLLLRSPRSRAQFEERF